MRGFMSNETNGNGYGLENPIAIYYEHPDWFRPLFQLLDERGVPWLKIDARHHNYDVASPEHEYSLLFNRMSPSAWQRGLGHVSSIRSTILRTSKVRACASSTATG